MGPDFVILEHDPIKQIKINLSYTMKKQLDIALIYPQADDNTEYPNYPLSVKLRSKVMPIKLVETLVKKSEAMIQKLSSTKDESTGEWTGKAQALPIFEFLQNIIENNNLIPAWDELPQIKEVLRLPGKQEEKKQESDELKLFEKAGKIKIKFRQRKFFLDVEISVPPEYPATKPELKFLDHNYD